MTGTEKAVEARLFGVLGDAELVGVRGAQLGLGEDGQPHLTNLATRIGRG